MSVGRRAFLGAAVVCLALTPCAEAHLVTTDLGPFYDGAVHAMITPLEVLTVLALAALAGLGGPTDGRAALVSLGCGWIVGAAAGFVTGVAPAGLEVFCPLAMISLGVGAAGNTRMGPGPVGVIALLLGLARGLLAGADSAAAGVGWKNLLGFTSSTLVLATLALAGMVWLSARPARIGVRVAASWIAALGLLLIGWQFRGVTGF